VRSASGISCDADANVTVTAFDSVVYFDFAASKVCLPVSDENIQ